MPTTSRFQNYSPPPNLDPPRQIPIDVLFKLNYNRLFVFQVDLEAAELSPRPVLTFYVNLLLMLA